ncbi:MAG: hypothetical protein H0T47_13695 [Planctomycetaceae bacterium]|nr:hypothetical protein [Planctomycetaceae bacterium]
MLSAFTAAVFAVDPNRRLPEPPLVSKDGPLTIVAPVHYADQMIVIITTDGVAAVKFDKSFDNETGEGVSYRFEYLATGAAKPIRNQSVAFEKRERLSNGQPGDLAGNRFIKAGKIMLEWSLGGPDKGYIYYEPEEATVLVVNAEWLEENGNPSSGSPAVRGKRLDLQRFQKPSQ